MYVCGYPVDRAAFKEHLSAKEACIFLIMKRLSTRIANKQLRTFSLDSFYRSQLVLFYFIYLFYVFLFTILVTVQANAVSLVAIIKVINECLQEDMKTFTRREVDQTIEVLLVKLHHTERIISQTA